MDDEPLFEIIDGQRVELSPMSILVSRVTSSIHVHLGHYLLGNPVGEALMETLFRLPLPVDRNRRPDVAFVSAQAIAQAPRNQVRTMPGPSFPSCWWKWSVPTISAKKSSNAWMNTLPRGPNWCGSCTPHGVSSTSTNRRTRCASWVKRKNWMEASCCRDSVLPSRRCFRRKQNSFDSQRALRHCTTFMGR